LTPKTEASEPGASALQRVLAGMIRLLPGVDRIL